MNHTNLGPDQAAPTTAEENMVSILCSLRTSLTAFIVDNVFGVQIVLGAQTIFEV